MTKERLEGHKFEKNDIQFEFKEVYNITGDVSYFDRRVYVFLGNYNA